MIATKLKAFFVRYNPPGSSINIPDELDDYFDPDKMVILEMGMQKGHLDEDGGIFSEAKSRAIIANINKFNRECRSLGIPIIHCGSSFRKGEADIRKAPFRRILPHSVGWLVPNPKNEIGSELADFVVEVKEEDLRLDVIKRYSAFENTDLEFLLKQLDRDVVVITGIGADCYGMSTAFYATCKDIKVIFAMDIAKALVEELDEATKTLVSLFIGLAIKSDELLLELKAQKAKKTNTEDIMLGEIS